MKVKQSLCEDMFDSTRVRILTPINSRFKMEDGDFNRQFDVYNYNVNTLSNWIFDKYKMGSAWWWKQSNVTKIPGD